MWELDYKESWVLKTWCFWTVVLEKALESPLDCKEIQPVHPKGDQSWVFIRRTDVEAETPILRPPDVKSWLIWKDSYAGKDWGQEEKGTPEDEMVGWDHRVWVDSRSWWWMGRPGVLQSMGSQRVGHDWATELNWAWWQLWKWGLSELTIETSTMADIGSILGNVNSSLYSQLPTPPWVPFDICQVFPWMFRSLPTPPHS